MSAQLERHLFTVEDYYRMASAGILLEDDRVELIEGEIIDTSPIGSPHAGCVMCLINLFARLLGDKAIISSQNPVRLSDLSEPQPDIALLEPRADFYRNIHPTARDVLLLIEVSDTTLDYDRKTKLPLYARSGIAEYWIIDLNAEAIEIYTKPANGTYTETQIVKRGENLVLHQAGDLTINADDILG